MKKIVNASAVEGNPPVQSKKDKREFFGQLVLVHTVFGVSIASPNSMVYVKLGNEYIRKPLEEIKKGEEILFAKEGIPGITLEKVGEALAKSDRYAATQPILFKRLNDGSYTTAFKCTLLEGIASANGWPEALSNDVSLKLSVQGSKPFDLANSQEIAAAECIRARLVGANAPAVKIHQIRHGWLGGRTLAPEHKDEVFSALEPIAPKLSELLEPAFNDAYKLYVVIRQSVMRAVSLILKGNASEMPKDKEEAETTEPVRSLSTRPEIKLVVEHFASDISKEYAAGNVLKIEALKMHSNVGNPHENGQLFKGVVTREINDPKIKVKTLSCMMTERSVLLPVLYRILYDYIKSENLFDPLSDFIGDDRPSKLLLKMLASEKLGGAEYHLWRLRKTAELLEKAGVRRIDGFFKDLWETFESKKAKGEEAEFRQISDVFYRKLYGGELDTLYSLPAGTLGKFFDYWFNLERGMPFDQEYQLTLRDIIEAKKQHESTTGQAVRIKEELKELNRINAKFKKMGVLGGIANPIDEIHVAATHLSSHDGLNCSMDEQVYSGKITPADALKQFGYDVHKEIGEGRLFDDKAAIKILHEIGFGHLEPLFPKADEFVKPVFSPLRAIFS